MNLKFILACVLLIGGLGGISAPAWGREAGPKAVIEDIFSQVKQQEISSSQALQEKVNDHIDFQQMAEKAMGSHYATLSPQDRQWFVATLRKLITKTVYRSAPDFLQEVKISYTDEEVDDQQASITSEVTKKAEITEVRYDMKKSADSWKVVDVAIDDESWTDSIRGEIQDIMATKKWAGLKQRMSERLQDLEKPAKKAAKQ